MELINRSLFRWQKSVYSVYCVDRRPGEIPVPSVLSESFRFISNRLDLVGFQHGSSQFGLPAFIAIFTSVSATTPKNHNYLLPYAS